MQKSSTQKEQIDFNQFIGPRYKFVSEIGQGAYGIVIKALDLKYNKHVAIKKLNNIEDIIDAKRSLREIRILRHLQHENILDLLNIIYYEASYEQEFGHVYLVTGFMEIDLFKVIFSQQELTDEHRQYIIYQILRGLKFLHSANVIHRDLKPSNILATETCDIKMCDFGLARNVGLDDQEFTEYVVTRYYRAPEIMLSSHEYSKPVDLWGVGCTFAELITGEVLFPGKTYISQIKIIMEKLGKPGPENLKFITNQNALKYIESLPNNPPVSVSSFITYENKLALDLLDKMLQIDPQKRITAEQALEHPYLATFHDPTDEPTYQGSVDFEFEIDPKINLKEIRILILEFKINQYFYIFSREINFYRKVNGETLLNIQKCMELVDEKQKILSEAGSPDQK